MKRANSNDVLRAINGLSAKLYGENGFEGDVPEIKEHLRQINGHLKDHSKRLVIAETQIEERTTNKMSKKTKAGYGSGIVAVLTLLFYIGQALGWWQL